MEPAPDGVIYFLRAEELPKRLGAYRTHSPVLLELVAAIHGPKSLELRLHKMFASSRRHGEWFDESPELMAVIAAHESGDETLPGEDTPEMVRGLRDRGWSIRRIANELNLGRGTVGRLVCGDGLNRPQALRPRQNAGWR